jgi:hypothetical protein
MTISDYVPNCITCKKKLRGLNCYIYERGIPEHILFNPPEENATMGLPCDGQSQYEPDPTKAPKRAVNGNGQVSG